MEQYLTVNDLWDIVTETETEPSDNTEKTKFLRKQKSARAPMTERSHVKSQIPTHPLEPQCLQREQSTTSHSTPLFHRLSCHAHYAEGRPTLRK